MPKSSCGLTTWFLPVYRSRTGKQGSIYAWRDKSSKFSCTRPNKANAVEGAWVVLQWQKRHERQIFPRAVGHNHAARGPHSSSLRFPIGPATLWEANAGPRCDGAAELSNRGLQAGADGEEAADGRKCDGGAVGVRVESGTPYNG